VLRTRVYAPTQCMHPHFSRRHAGTPLSSAQSSQSSALPQVSSRATLRSQDSEPDARYRGMAATHTDNDASRRIPTICITNTRTGCVQARLVGRQHSRSRAFWAKTALLSIFWRQRLLPAY